MKIVYETRNFWVCDIGKKGFEVYKAEVTVSKKIASIGLGKNLGLQRAIEECDRRQAQEDCLRNHSRGR